MKQINCFFDGSIQNLEGQYQCETKDYHKPLVGIYFTQETTDYAYAGNNKMNDKVPFLQCPSYTFKCEQERSKYTMFLRHS